MLRVLHLPEHLVSQSTIIFNPITRKPLRHALVAYSVPLSGGAASNSIISSHSDHCGTWDGPILVYAIKELIDIPRKQPAGYRDLVGHEDHAHMADSNEGLELYNIQNFDKRTPDDIDAEDYGHFLDTEIALSYGTCQCPERPLPEKIDSLYSWDSEVKGYHFQMSRNRDMVDFDMAEIILKYDDFRGLPIPEFSVRIGMPLRILIMDDIANTEKRLHYWLGKQREIRHRGLAYTNRRSFLPSRSHLLPLVNLKPYWPIVFPFDANHQRYNNLLVIRADALPLSMAYLIAMEKFLEDYQERCKTPACLGGLQGALDAEDPLSGLSREEFDQFVKTNQMNGKWDLWDAGMD